MDGTYTKKEVLLPDDSSAGLSGFASGILKTHTRLEYIPEHTILGILDPNTTDYFGFRNRHDMEHLSSMLEEFAPLSHPCLFYPAGGRYLKDNRQEYFYGIGLEQAPKADHETVRSLQLFHVYIAAAEKSRAIISYFFPPFNSCMRYTDVSWSYIPATVWNSCFRTGIWMKKQKLRSCKRLKANGRFLAFV